MPISPKSLSSHTRRRRLELLIPSLVVALAGVLTTYTLGMRWQREAARASSSEIMLGLSNFQVRQGQRCIGSIESALTNERLLHWRIRGKAQLQENPTSPVEAVEVSADSFFNPLGQLFQARLSLSYRDFALKIETLDVHPIRLNAEINGPDLKISRAVSLPGPVLLQPHSADASRYRFRYHYTPQLASGPLESGFSQLGATLQLTATAGAACTSLEAADLSHIRTAVAAMTPLLLQRLQQHLPQSQSISGIPQLKGEAP